MAHRANRYLQLVRLSSGQISHTHRQRFDHFQLSDEEFRKRYRLCKEIVFVVAQQISGDIQPKTGRNRALSAMEMLLLTLRLYATGSFLITAADYCGVSVMTACRTVKKVSGTLAKLYPKYIAMPTNTDLQSNANKFYKIAKFPKVLGCIDCTHIRIESPGGESAELYRNRKEYFSINVQAICNANLEIVDVVARWPGSAHDSNILNNSRIKARLERGEFKDYYLLGDSGYGVKPYIMTPLSNPITGPEKLYNESQIRTRNAIERCFGGLKRRFPILSLGIRLCIETVMSVIVACIVLHNIARKNNEDEPPIQFEVEVEQFNNESTSNTNTQSSVRNHLITNYFAML